MPAPPSPRRIARGCACTQNTPRLGGSLRAWLGWQEGGGGGGWVGAWGQGGGVREGVGV
jgi:hypothetical protein